MTIAVGDILRMVAKMTLPDGSEANWVWHQLVTLGTTESDLVVLTALRDELDTACNLIEATISDQVDSTEVELFKWDGVLNRFDGIAQLAWTTFNGSDGGTLLFNQQSLLVKFFTELGRRQGRKYFPNGTEISAIGNAWSAAALAAAVSWSAVLDDALVTGSVTCTPCTFNTTPTSPIFETTQLFTGATAVDTVPSTQRRRKVGVGI